MIENLIHVLTHNPLYLITGIILVILVILPTRKSSPASKNIVYLAAIIWIICFAYKFNTGQDIFRQLANNVNNEINAESQPLKIKGPFNKYYSDESGRVPRKNL